MKGITQKVENSTFRLYGILLNMQPRLQGCIQQLLRHQTLYIFGGVT